jgi:adenylate cyclase
VDPENINLHYNLACAMAALKEVDMALDTLAEIADNLSPGMVSWLESDNDFDLIREEPRFISIVTQVKARLAKGRRPS